ncbi:hypothetical protein CISIN_1g036886mg [Citrus sinensis]|uniref:Uncharacterized protein n=1 Tax=Citrus sinensis TaxID=2711 RepID=A0A067EV51_CITSI|nr:hypothetical protein CISIN_1g036886mg [Citrus sinensis]
MYIVLKKVDLQVHSSRKYFGLFNFIYSLSCYIIRKQKDPSKAHQTKLDVIVKALKWLEMDMDVDEVECVVALLLHKNLVKGYFAR